MTDNNYNTEIIREYELTRQKRFVYCWEYHHKGFVNLAHRHKCDKCLVYQARAQRCFILSDVGGHKRVHCLDNCSKCGYFQKYFG